MTFELRLSFQNKDDRNHFAKVIEMILTHCEIEYKFPKEEEE